MLRSFQFIGRLLFGASFGLMFGLIVGTYCWRICAMLHIPSRPLYHQIWLVTAMLISSLFFLLCPMKRGTKTFVSSAGYLVFVMAGWIWSGYSENVISLGLGGFLITSYMAYAQGEFGPGEVRQ